MKAHFNLSPIYLEKAIKKMTTPQIKLVQMLANDYRAKDIAKKLSVGVVCIQNRISNLREIFESRSYIGLVVLFFKNGLVK